MIQARDGRLESDWWHTAQLLAQFHNAHRQKGSPSVSPSKLNPFAKAEPVTKRTVTEDDMRILFGG